MQFIWLHYERFNFARYCLTLVRRDYPALPELLRLKYYRAESDGWRDIIHCGSCVTRVQNRLRPATGCLRPDNCNCTVCRREPPSLLASASNTLFRLVLELRRFALTYETTYSQYVIAVRSRKVPDRQLLPPNFSFICLSFRCDAFSRKLHRHCPGNGTWEVEIRRTLESEGDTIVCLVALKNLFWCTHCERGLFFSPLCLQHPTF